MPHLNYRRGDTRHRAQSYPWDWRNLKVPNHRKFRSKETRSMQKMRQLAEPEDMNDIWFPERVWEGDNRYNYD